MPSVTNTAGASVPPSEATEASPKVFIIVGVTTTRNVTRRSGVSAGVTSKPNGASCTCDVLSPPYDEAR